MGKDSVQDKIGLYGYKAGVNTFGLMENGTAFLELKVVEDRSLLMELQRRFMVEGILQKKVGMPLME